MIALTFVAFLLMCRSVESTTAPTVNTTNENYTGANPNGPNLELLKNCLRPTPTVCSANLFVSDTFYGMLTYSFGNLHELKITLKSISSELSVLFHFYVCYLNDFVLAQDELSKALDGFEPVNNKAVEFRRTCETVPSSQCDDLTNQHL